MLGGRGRALGTPWGLESHSSVGVCLMLGTQGGKGLLPTRPPAAHLSLQMVEGRRWGDGAGLIFGLEDSEVVGGAIQLLPDPSPLFQKLRVLGRHWGRRCVGGETVLGAGGSGAERGTNHQEQQINLPHFWC